MEKLNLVGHFGAVKTTRDYMVIKKRAKSARIEKQKPVVEKCKLLAFVNFMLKSKYENRA